MNPIPMVLTGFALPHTLGYQSLQNGTPNPRPWDVPAYLDYAVSLGYEGVEMPLFRPGVPSLAELRDLLVARNLRIIPAGGAMSDGSSNDEMGAFLRGAKELDAPVVRVTVSGILCGDRRGFDWAMHWEKTVARFKAALPLAEELGIAIAVENHQDVTSDDLIELYERTGSSVAFGVCLDAGNPLAVGEGPVEFATRLSSLIRHVHCKDYTIHFAPSGYRLVRCVAGDGCVDFPAILAALNNPSLGNEVAALATRTIPLLEETWWEPHRATQKRHLPEALRVLWRRGYTEDVPYGSVWERGGDSAAVCAEEQSVVERSTTYFRGVLEC